MTQRPAPDGAQPTSPRSQGRRASAFKRIAPAGVLLLLALTLLVPTTAAAGGNVGMVRDFDTVLFDATLHPVPSHCQFAHRTVVPGGLQDRMHCRLGPGATLPDTAVTLTDVPRLRYVSDYAFLALGERQVASTWTVSLTPGGTFVLVAFYATP